MRKQITQTLLAAAVGGLVLGVTPASAASFSINFGFPGIGFSYNSGGYCDEWGCPDYFWNYPIYYCPVYYAGRWYSGPMYYRYYRGSYRYWIHGDWRRDYWNRPRPRGACVDRYGPPLDLDFYIWNGFNVRDEWRYNWRRHRNDWWNHRQDWDRNNRSDTRWRNWLPSQQRNYDWNRERDWNSNREWTRPDWNRRDWERKNNINRATTAVPTPPAGPPGTFIPPLNKGGQVKPPSQMAPAITPPPTNTPFPDTGGRFRDRLKGGQGAGGTSGFTAPPTTQPTPTITPPATNTPLDRGGRMHDHWKGIPSGQSTSGTSGGSVTPQTAPAFTPPAATNPPTDLRGHTRDRSKGGQGTMGASGSQGGTTTPSTQTTAPATTTLPPDQGGDRRKHKQGQDNQGDHPTNP